MNTTDLIFAVSSPPGRSPRGIVRGSGAGVFDVIANIATPEALSISSVDVRIGKPGRSSEGQPSSRHLSQPVDQGERRRVVRPVRLALSREVDLPAILLTFPGPHSYTGDDVVELLLPGHPALLERVVDRLIEAARRTNRSARRADAGEFTARAFFNGRVDLTEAEGISATIAARSDAELRAANLLTSGRLGSFARAVADDLANALALVEAGIDFTDQEDVVAISPHDLARRLDDLTARIDAQLERAVGFESLEAIPWVVLVGPPNAGKSTLFNALLGSARAVVSDIAGTTRDVLCEPLTILVDDDHTAEVMLVDVAGLEESSCGPLNESMRNAVLAALERAELVVLCGGADAADAAEAWRPSALIRSRIASTPVVHVLTKCDLAASSSAGRNSWRTDDGEMKNMVSARTGEGLEALRRAIAERLASRAVSLAADALALHPRHEAALRSVRSNLAAARDLIEPLRRERHFDRPEFVAGLMRAALDDLASLAGTISPDEVLGRIFASFCVGK